ncbi:MAG: GspH/FimT family protein [Burkholderiales bacterium]
MRRIQQGMTMIEMMIALAIAALILMLALPSFSIFLQNTQIRNGAESILSGLNFARTEAVRLNTPVRFQFVSDLTATCTLSTTSLAWVVSQANPTAACNVAPGSGLAPLIMQTRSASEGTNNVVVAVTGGSTAIFNGLGRLQSAGITQIDISNTSGTCQYADPVNGTMRCLRIMVSSGGQARLCDPQVATPVPPVIDPRAC